MSKINENTTEMKYSNTMHLSYSIGQMIKQFLEVAFTVRVFFYYENEVLLPVLLLGIGYVFYGLWNMINDPLIGHFCDKSKLFTKKWGKRYPWIMLGVFANIFVYLLVFSPPNVDPKSNPTLIFIYFLIIICVFDGFFSLWTINYFSLFPLKFQSDAERRKVNGIKTILAQIGLFLAVLIPPLFIEYGDKQSYFIAAIAISLFAFILAFFMIRGVREDKELIDMIIRIENTQPKQSFVKNMKVALKQKNFITFVIAATLFNIFAIILMASLPFLVRFILKMPAETEIILLLGFLLTATASVPMWTKITKKIGNRKLYGYGFFMSMALVGFFLIVQDLFSVMILMLLAGISVGALWVGTSLILADVIDESVTINKKRQEGIYFGITNFFGRLEVVAQALAFTVIHILTGFEPGSPNQSVLALWGLRIQISLIPMVSMLVGGIIFWKYYDLTPEKLKVIHTKLKELNIS